MYIYICIYIYIYIYVSILSGLQGARPRTAGPRARRTGTGVSNNNKLLIKLLIRVM